MIDAIATYPALRMTALFGIFLAMFLGVTMLARVLASRNVMRRRLEETSIAVLVPSLGGSAYLREEKKQESWSKLADTLERAGIPLSDSSNNKLRAKLALAGFPSPAAPSLFTLCRLALLFALPALFLLSTLGQSQRPSFVILYLGSVTLGIVGMYMPNLWLHARAEGRKQEMINGFPDCLDLMLVCVEAGLGMEAAFDRVGREVMGSHPRLAELLSSATLELRAGASREQSLRSMAQRAQVEEIRSFATLLIQSDALGTSIGATLRVYATEMREKRRMRAEEKAHKLPVLLSIPLVSCLLPSMIAVLMLPAAIQVVKVLLPLLQGPQ